ncbi:MAG: hypothetical protein J5643_08755 [Lachnospiraceae bacterium]|nr:hypothetical protein [Lachnospiraceae bacterium]
MKKKTTQLIETSSWILLILFPLAFICFLGYVMLTHKPSPGSSIGTGDIIMVFVMGAAIAEAILFLIWRMVRKMRIKNEWERPLDVFLVFCGSHRMAVIIISLLVLFLLTLVGVYWVQDKMLFYPDDGIFDGAELENDDEVSTFLLEKNIMGFTNKMVRGSYWFSMEETRRVVLQR